jgi:hypothetical protein
MLVCLNLFKNLISIMTYNKIVIDTQLILVLKVISKFHF